MKKIIVTGNVGRDVTAHASPNGNQFAVFSIGVSVGTKQSPKTDWIEVVCNDKLAEIAKNYIKKGTRLLIEGFPSVSAYINKENKAVGTLKINANNFEFLNKREEESEPITDVSDLPHLKFTSKSTMEDLNSIPF